MCACVRVYVCLCVYLCVCVCAIEWETSFISTPHDSAVQLVLRFVFSDVFFFLSPQRNEVKEATRDLFFSSLKTNAGGALLSEDCNIGQALFFKSCSTLISYYLSRGDGRRHGT